MFLTINNAVKACGRIVVVSLVLNGALLGQSFAQHGDIDVDIES